jgi:hypothetical protein
MNANNNLILFHVLYKMKHRQNSLEVHYLQNVFFDSDGRKMARDSH